MCGLPPEYCEFGPNFEKCKPWILEHCPEVYPNLLSLNDEEKTEKEGGDKEKSSSKRGLSIIYSLYSCFKGGKGQVKPIADDTDVKLLPGGKVKKKVAFSIQVGIQEIVF